MTARTLAKMRHPLKIVGLLLIAGALARDWVNLTSLIGLAAASFAVGLSVGEDLVNEMVEKEQASR